MVNVLFLALCILCVADITVSGKKCKTQIFKDALTQKALKSHVIKKEKASDERHCRIKCYMDDRCISYNYGLDANNTSNMCELSDSDNVMHPSDLIGRQGTVYRRAENKCKCESFEVCTINWSDDSHQCGCKPRFTGATCEIEMKPCDSSPCQNQGTCVGDIAAFTFSCKCLANFTGTFCQLKKPCVPNPCLNNGSCITGAGNIGYTCSCVGGFLGANCQTADPCLATPCSNGGTCVAGADNIGYTCNCASGFLGANCQTADPCLANPCSNGGTCNVGADNINYTCSCVGGFLGVNCQTADPCHATPCQLPGGSCVAGANNIGYTCSCASGFSGVNCQIASNPCLLNPCLNGGTCAVDGIGYTCTCKSTALGKNCNSVMVGKGKGTWNVANTECQKLGGKLPSIHSAAENLVAKELYKKVNGFMWIGLKKGSDGTFTWTDSSPVDYTNWKASGNLKQCGYIEYSGVWATVPCNYNHDYVCVSK